MLLCTGALWLGSVGALHAQAPAASSLDAIWEAYQQLDYALAADSARAALARYEQFSVGELAELHLILGLVAFSQDQPEQARLEFAAALDLQAAIQLDELLVSPKIMEFFEAVRAERAQLQQVEGETPSAVRYVIVEDQRAEAALRSMVLPGWGQLHKGERFKGRVLVGLWGAVVAGGAAAHLLRQRAAEDYRAAATPAEALDRYAPFDRWHRTRNALLVGAAGIWLYSYVDALIARGAPATRRGFQVAPALAPRAVHLSLQLRF